MRKFAKIIFALTFLDCKSDFNKSDDSEANHNVDAANTTRGNSNVSDTS